MYPNFDLFLKANELGIRLEITAGSYTWETSPVLRHHKAKDRIRTTIHPSQGTGCGCVHYADVYVGFPDGSLKRPDISIFCREPDETTQAVALIPEAVIEVISEGCETKDLEINPSFYLSQGVKDVLVLDPDTGFVLPARRDGRKRYTSPQAFELECGCSVTI